MRTDGKEGGYVLDGGLLHAGWDCLLVQCGRGLPICWWTEEKVSVPLDVESACWTSFVCYWEYNAADQKEVEVKQP